MARLRLLLAWLGWSALALLLRSLRLAPSALRWFLFLPRGAFGRLLSKRENARAALRLLRLLLWAALAAGLAWASATGRLR